MADSYDLVVVGAGVAGLLAAVAARRLGDRVLVVDADSLAGGSTALSDGMMWLPDAQAPRSAPQDSVEDAAEYLDALLGSTTTASSAERRAAYVRTAGKLARWLISSNIPLAVEKGLGDDRPDLPGGRTGGRVLATQPFDRGVLGEWDDALRPAVEGGRGFLSRVLPGGRVTRTAGEALAGHLLHRATANGVDVWLDSPVVALQGGPDGITGVVVRRDDADVTVDAPRVLLASGGFERNQDLREEYLPLPTDAAWSTSGARNVGDLLTLAVSAGAATACLDEAWWKPVMLAEGRAWALDDARRAPHSLIVDSAGDRFFDESLPANAAGRALYERSRGMRAVPSFLVMDNRHRQSTPLGPWTAGSTPKKALDAGEIVRAGTLNDLAQALGIDRAGLLGSVVRFNGFASKGKDLDFSRGEAATAAPGDRGRRRGGSLGKVDKPAFWAVKVYPGDSGTKGGLVIDDRSRVLRADGTPLPGLYACGGAAASLFKGTCPGPGAALGAALVEAFLAATDRPSA
ncbi:MAG: FAD-dependent oxidoreductase [Actinobacteria bacterium]|nr:FAD-dependent oxidoreductase [Actinomycetota bacterium]